MKKETITYIICCLIWAVCAFQFIRLGFVIPQACGIDKEFLYCHLHPLSALSVIGLILFGVSFVFVTGVWKFFTGELLTDKAFTYAAIGFLVGAVGIGLIFAQ